MSFSQLRSEESYCLRWRYSLDVFSFFPISHRAVLTSTLRSHCDIIPFSRGGLFYIVELLDALSLSVPQFNPPLPTKAINHRATGLSCLSGPSFFLSFTRHLPHFTPGFVPSGPFVPRNWSYPSSGRLIFLALLPSLFSLAAHTGWSVVLPAFRIFTQLFTICFN